MLMVRLVCFSLFALGGMSLGAEVEISADRNADVLGTHWLTLSAPIRSWDCALPLGNGLTGGLLWGEGSELRLSLDRGDLWDERGNEDVYSPERNFETLKASANRSGRSTFRSLFMNVYQNSPWTKLPGGRLVVKLPPGKQSKSFQLAFEKATGTVEFGDGTHARVFFSATEPIALMRLPKGSSFELIHPRAIDSLGYPDPVFSKSGNEVAYLQKTAEELAYAVAVQWRDEGDHILAVVAMTSNHEAENPLELARARIADGFEHGWDALYAKHLAWWKEFYNTSSITLPSPRIQYHYNLAKYLYGAGSRSYAPPMPLQGVWTADGGGLPPWKGDYHNDLNTQMTYVAWQAAGLVDSGMAYINFYWDRLPQFRKYGREFFGVDGPMVPGVMSLRGQAMGGWPQYGYMLTAGLWNGHAFYMHWKTTCDDEFLAERAYPWLSEITDAVLSLAEEKNGELKLPVSVSPEWNSEKFTAYLKPNCNFDQALLIWATEALKEMAAALGREAEVEKWAAVRAKLGPLLYDMQTGALLVAEGVPLEHSHRHHSHALAIHPLGILNVHQSEEARRAVQATVRQLIDSEPRHWTGYSYTWAAALAARAGFADDAERCLSEFARAYVSRNGFHLNSNQLNPKSRRYRAFTLEGNFMLMDAVQEMCMQSYGGIVQVFPAIPDSWKDVSFTDLRAEGGSRVSAERADGVTTEVKIAATCESVLRLIDPFAGSEAKWSVNYERQGACLVFKLRAGEVVTGTAAVEYE